MEKKWLLCDLHVHTTFSDGVLDLRSLIDFYGKRRFDVISVTDHLQDLETLKRSMSAGKTVHSLRRENFDEYLNALRNGARYSWETYRMLLIPGVELTNDTKSYHLLIVDVKDYIDPSLPIEEIAAKAQKQEALVIAAHPCRKLDEDGSMSILWENHEEYEKLIDAWEIANRDELYSALGPTGYRFVACSDLHKPEHIYSWKTLVYAEKNVESFKKAVKAGKTAIHFYDSRFDSNRIDV